MNLRNQFAALGSHERIKPTSGTLIGSCFVLSYALEMFPRYFREKTETQLAVTKIVVLTCPDSKHFLKQVRIIYIPEIQ